jgi:hypothetical protein
MCGVPATEVSRLILMGGTMKKVRRANNPPFLVHSQGRHYAKTTTIICQRQAIVPRICDSISLYLHLVVPCYTFRRNEVTNLYLHRSVRDVRAIACSTCRRAKMKCLNTTGNTKCDRCIKWDTECVFEAHRRGRRRRTGFPQVYEL